MTKKAPKSPKKESPPIQINRSRGGGKKRPDLFARLRNDEHPIDSLLGATNSDAQPSATNDVRVDIATDIRTINQSDAQIELNPDARVNNELDAQNITNSDVQHTINTDTHHTSLRTSAAKLHGQPTTFNSDPQLELLRTPDSEQHGQPIYDESDVSTPKNKTRTPKPATRLDAQAPKSQNTDARRKEWDAKYDSKRSTDRLAIRPDREILKKIKIFCVEKNLKLTEFIEIACLRFIELDAQAADNSGVLTPLDDGRLMKMYKSKPFIINLYLRYNAIFNEISSADGKKWSARWNPRDDEAGVRFNELPPMVIELGIIQTQIQKGIGSGKIQTFKYYTEEIQKVVDSGVSDEVLSTLLIYHRSVWRNQTGREVDLSFLEEAKRQAQK